MKKLVQKAEEEWEELPGIRNQLGEPTGRARKAAIKGALAAVTEWLQRDGDLRGRLEATGEPLRGKPRAERPDGSGRRPRRRARTAEEQRDFVKEYVIPRLDHEFGTSRMAEFQARAVEAHFWCELLAQTARALKCYKELNEEAKRLVVAALTAEDTPLPEWQRVLPYQDMVRRAVDLVFDMLPRAAGLPSAADAAELILPVCLLGCLMCKDPREHETVREHCLNPILKCGTAQVREEVRQRMEWTFPDEWPDSGTAGAS